MFRKFFKVLGIIVILVAIVLGVLYAKYNEPLPEGRSGPDADALALKMLNSLNYTKYENTKYLEWSFRKGAHLYTWDKEKKRVEVQWDDIRVNLDLIAPDSSLGYRNGERVNANENEELIEEAMEMFNNDSFWLVAPYKIFDAGTRREIVDLNDGLDGLLVTYDTGGTTPGDSYLWILQPSGFPKSFKIWADVTPIGGLEASWEDWLVTDSGAFLPKTHFMGPFELHMGDVKGYNH